MNPPAPPKPPKGRVRDTLSDRPIGVEQENDLYSAREVTQVTDQPSMYRKLEKLDGLMQRTVRHVSEIPEIKEKVNATSEKVIELKAKAEALDTRVDGVERRLDRGHDCFQVEVIGKLSENGKSAAAAILDDSHQAIRVEGKIESIENDVKMIHKSRNWLVGVLVGLLVPVLGGISTSIWFAATLNARVETQERQQREQIDRVQKVITTSSQQHTKAIQGLDEQIERAGKSPPAVDVRQQDWYKQLPQVERRRLDLALKALKAPPEREPERGP